MNSDYSDYMKILKEYLAKGNLTPEDKKFVLRYIVANKNIKQISLATYPDSKSVLTNDLIKTKEYLKNTNQLSGEYLERLLVIYDRAITLKPDSDKQDIISLYYQLEKLKTQCNINSRHADVVCMGLKEEHYVRRS